jgi:transcriptional regulator with XRE-family HTH domain
MKKTPFQEGLRAFMKRKEYTQEELANIVGLTRTAINYWVNGRHEPVLRDINKLREAGMTLEEIFGKA